MNWDALIYLLCLGGGFLFLIILALMGHFVDGTGQAEVGALGSDSGGVSVFSPMIIAAFMTGFGAFGYLLTLVPATQSASIRCG